MKTREIADFEAREQIRLFLADAELEEIAAIYTRYCTNDRVRVFGPAFVPGVIDYSDYYRSGEKT